MKKSTNRYIKSLVVSAIIAAAYAGLTYLSAFFNLAYGPVQFRISEVLTILPIFTPAAIPGLTVGCLIANIMSYNPIDMLFGTLATLIASLITYYLRNVRVCLLPLLSILSPIVVNALIVGFEIAVFFTEGDASFGGFVLSALSVAVGEAAVCLLIGIPFYYAVEKREDKLFKNIS